MAKVKCPRCRTAIEAVKDELGIITCSSCGARLRTKTAKNTTVGSPTGASQASSHPATRTGEVDRVMARVEAPDPNATLRPNAPLPHFQRSAPPQPASLEAILAEIRGMRRTQEEILSLLRSRGGDGSRAAPEQPQLGTDPPRAQRRAGAGRSVLLIDDDQASRAAAHGALQAASMTVATAEDGNQALAAIAREKPDVVVLEVGIRGTMPGKDVINMIKATMEWVDIPIVIWTRMPVPDDPESLQAYSADAIVPKGPGAADRLRAQVDALLAPA